jgi:putative MFS transporter
LPARDSPGALPAAAAQPSPRYLWLLLAMLLPATIFEGYDITIFHLCTPDIARSFHLSDALVGTIAAIVRAGGLMSFFVVTLADTWGRKRVLANTVLAYALLTLLTGLSRGVLSFVICQTTAQVFLAAEFGLAVTVITEEFPDAARGRAVSLLLTSAFIGVGTAGLLYGPMAATRFGWRAMYLLGVLPLVLIAIIRRRMRETERFTAASARRGAPRRSIFAPISRCLAAFATLGDTRVFFVALLCNCAGLAGGTIISFFSLYAERERGWTSGQVGLAFVIAYVAGSCGTLISGWLLDRLGRRPTATLFFLAASVSAALLFRSRSHPAVFAALAAAMLSYQAARTATCALAGEIFPTNSRATGFNLTVQVIGQFGWLLAPLAVGLLSVPLGGLDRAAALCAAGPLVGALLAATMVPETAGRTLEELAPDMPS